MRYTYDKSHGLITVLECFYFKIILILCNSTAKIVLQRSHFSSNNLSNPSLPQCLV